MLLATLCQCERYISSGIILIEAQPNIIERFPMDTTDTAYDGADSWMKQKYATLKPYINIARPDHWFKNVFMLPGLLLALALGATLPDNYMWVFIAGIVSVCLIASANYTINEWLDAEFDRHHPVKKNRPSVSGAIKPQFVVLQWLLLSAAGLYLSHLIKVEFLIANAALLVMGILYNVNPIRTKDRVYIDVLSEAINNPLRFLLGWYLVVAPLIPPSSVLLSYWMGGAFLMAVKRYAEYRFIDDPARAGLYRKSFVSYTEEKLLLSAFFYALMSAVFLGVFLVKYKIEFLLTLPLFAILFVWYLYIGMQTNSVSQAPEKLYKQKKFVTFVTILGVVAVGVLFMELPWLNVLLEVHQPN